MRRTVSCFMAIHICAVAVCCIHAQQQNQVSSLFWFNLIDKARIKKIKRKIYFLSRLVDSVQLVMLKSKEVSVLDRAV
jgi:hypothetical protein